MRRASDMKSGDIIKVITLGTCVVIKPYTIHGMTSDHGHLPVRLRVLEGSTIKLVWEAVKCRRAACFQVVSYVPGSPADPHKHSQDWKSPANLDAALEAAP